MESINIVIADDVEANNMFLEQTLKRDSRINIVGVAMDGEQEYDLIKKYNPDLVITDNTMPKMKGIEVIRKIASEDLEKKPAFMIISGDTLGILEKELNVIGIFAKPVDYDMVLRMIDDYMQEDENKIDEKIVQNSKKKKGVFEILFNKIRNI